jgi:glycosyltransferase involved in cell wall biosynthesis
MASKKIVRIIARLNIGGPAIHTVLLSSELNKRGYKDILVCGNVGDSEGDMMYFAKEKNVVPIVIPGLGREISILNDLRSFAALVSIIKRERPVIVHTHTAKAGALGRLAAIFAGVPVKVHTFHGHVFDGYFNPVKAKAFLLIERFLALFTDRIITVSELIRNEIAGKLKVTKPSRCVVVPLGFELDHFLVCEKNKGLFRKELNIGQETLLVGIVGRLVPIKNHKMFLRVAKNITANNKGKNIKFVIIGDGECASELKELTGHLGLEGGVVFTGWRRDLVQVYADLDIVALTSLNEGTPVSIIEALACAKPVVVTDVGGIRDVVSHGQNGLIAASDDVNDFSDKLSDLLTDEEKRSRFGANGRESVRVKYSKERLVKDMESLYEECLKNAL